MMIQHKNVLRANIDFHNNTANKYEKKPLVVGKFTTKRVDSIIKHLSEASDSETFLDLGTGTGNLFDFTEKYFKKTFGLDVSINMLKLQKPGRRLCIGDANNAPYKSDTFSCIGGFSLLHHFHDLKPIVKECHRVLKKGGMFYSDYDPNYYFKKLINPIARFFDKRIKDVKTDEFDLAEYYGRSGLKPGYVVNLLKKQGFKDIKVIYHMFALSLIRIELIAYIIDKLTNALRINFLMRYFSPQFSIIAKK